MTKERIEELIIKASLTRQERNEIREAAVAAGVRVEFKQACRHCYEKALTALYELEGGERAVSMDGYQFRRRGAAFRLQGILYSEATLPGMTIGNLHPDVIRRYFIKTADSAAERIEGNGTDGEI